MLGDEGCDHPVQLHGMCAVCGAELTDDQTTNSFLTSHSNATVKVSAAEAQRLDDETTAHLLTSRRLALIVDLDQTIIHATVEETVGAWMRDPSNPNHAALSDVGYFQLDIEGKMMPTPPSPSSSGGEGSAVSAEPPRPGHWYYVKPRPGLPAFLQELSQIYELHVYTMGTRSYADNVCKLVDPTGRLFGSRILSRDENGSMAQKSLSRLFPVDTSMVVIIDDRADVWSWSPNLVKVIPFNFFPGTGDINGAFLPTQPPPPTPPVEASQSSVSDSSSETALASSSTSVSDKDSSATSPQSSLEAEEAATRAQQGELADKKPLAKMQEALDVKRREAIAQVVEGEAEPNGTDNHSNSEEATPADGASEATSATSATSIEAIEVKAEEIAAAPDLASSPAQAAAAETLAHTPKAILNTHDRELARIQSLLEEIHRRWYTEWDRRLAAASVPMPPIPGTNLPPQPSAPAIRPEAMGIIATLKKSVLAGCGLVFSSVVPLGQAPQTSESWILAEEFGARCHVDIERTVTHVVAAKPGTAKVNQAQRSPRMHAVWQSWLSDSIARWERQPESSYALPEMTVAGSTADAPSEGTWGDGDDDETEEDDYGESGDGADMTFSGVDWANVDAEVDAFLDGSDDEDDSDTEGYASDNSRTSRSARKRGRASTGSNLGDDGDSDGDTLAQKDDGSASQPTSPLSKRRKLAESRSGSSLKHQVAADEGTESEGGADGLPGPDDDDQNGSKINGYSNHPTPGGNLTDSSEADQNLLDELANEMEAQLASDDE